MSSEVHARAFTVFVAGMLADTDRYFASGNPDPMREGASHKVGAVWLSDREHGELLGPDQSLRATEDQETTCVHPQ